MGQAYCLLPIAKNAPYRNCYQNNSLCYFNHLWCTEAQVKSTVHHLTSKAHLPEELFRYKAQAELEPIAGEERLLVHVSAMNIEKKEHYTVLDALITLFYKQKAVKSFVSFARRACSGYAPVLSAWIFIETWCLALPLGKHFYWFWVSSEAHLWISNVPPFSED